MKLYKRKKSHGQVVFIPFERLNQWQRIKIIRTHQRLYQAYKRLNHKDEKQIAYWHKIWNETDESGNFSLQMFARTMINAIHYGPDYIIRNTALRLNECRELKTIHNNIILKWKKG